MTRTITCTLSMLCLLASVADAQVTASSYSTGGTAISTAKGVGNTRLNASSNASGGGYARSNISGRGTNGGYATGNSNASSYGGVAISNGKSVANGWGARSDVNSDARSIGGYARSDGKAVANGTWANAAADARARAFFDYSRSDAEAIDNRNWNSAPTPPVTTFGSAAAPASTNQWNGQSSGLMRTQVTTVQPLGNGGSFRSNNKSFRSTGGNSFRSQASSFIRRW